MLNCIRTSMTRLLFASSLVPSGVLFSSTRACTIRCLMKCRAHFQCLNADAENLNGECGAWLKLIGWMHRILAKEYRKLTVVWRSGSRVFFSPIFNKIIDKARWCTSQTSRCCNFQRISRAFQMFANAKRT